MFNAIGATLSCNHLAVRGTYYQPPSCLPAEDSRDAWEVKLQLSFTLLGPCALQPEPANRGRGVARLTPAQGANGALSYSCPRGCVHRTAEHSACDASRASAEQTVETRSQAGLPGPRHRGSQVCLGWKGRGGSWCHTHRLTRRHSSLTSPF